MKKNLTTIEVIGLAIKSEENASRLYASISNTIKNKIVKEKYKDLAKEEIEHRQILVNLYKQMTGEKNAPPEIPGEPDTAEGGFPVIALDNLEEILKFAIFREQEAYSFYLNAASEASDPNAKKTLTYLANIENGHELMLKSELDAYKADENYFADNPDIDLVGP